ncbi:hypothetical protein [Dyella silvae]|uniref:hypothetical protein n=1 Tax=Dyella silvae TaxID=2994424 RepID=UPI002264A5A6|nr:hypothetical protein [Dyella silvae]
MRALNASAPSPRRTRSRYVMWCALLVTCAAAALSVHAQTSGTRASQSATQTQNADQLAIQVNDDRMTLAVAKVPQIYLYGPIDANAPQRVEALIKSHKIPEGSDIYLNSPGGDIDAGLALGRLFRSGAMTTHLGSPRRTARSPVVPKASSCVNACAFAFAGGLYRWAPTGNDRMGVQAIDGASPNTGKLADYLKDMGVNPLVFSNAPGNDVAWLTNDQVLGYNLANNGRIPPTAVNRPMNGVASLSLTQMARDGEHRLTLLCRPDGITVTAYYTIGAERSRQIVARATQSYFELNHQPATEREHMGIAAVAQSVVFSQPIPLTQLDQLLSARSMGAWLADKGGAVRYGFWMELDPVRDNLRDYRNSCLQIAKAQTPAAKG